jgi:hypothetical protein
VLVSSNAISDLPISAVAWRAICGMMSKPAPAMPETAIVRVLAGTASFSQPFAYLLIPTFTISADFDKGKAAREMWGCCVQLMRCVVHTNN